MQKKLPVLRLIYDAFGVGYKNVWVFSKCILLVGKTLTYFANLIDDY